MARWQFFFVSLLIHGTLGKIGMGRRVLDEHPEIVQYFATLPESCTTFHGCETFDVNNPPDLNTGDFDENIGFDIVEWYCCSLKSDSAEDLYEAADLWHNGICGSAYTTYLLSKHIDDLTLSEQHVLYYCPSIEGETHIWHTYTWTDLWSVVTLGFLASNESPFLSCPLDSQTVTDQVSFIITPYEQDILPHVYVQHGESIFGWGPVSIATDEFNSVTGGAGQFQVISSDNFQFTEDSYILELNVDVSSMMDEYLTIEEEGSYSLIDHNCGHVGLRLLAAGLGCQAQLVPFFTPVAMRSVLMNLVQEQEQGVGARLRKINRALRQALNALVN